MMPRLECVEGFGFRLRKRWKRTKSDMPRENTHLQNLIVCCSAIFISLLFFLLTARSWFVGDTRYGADGNFKDSPFWLADRVASVRPISWALNHQLSFQGKSNALSTANPRQSFHFIVSHSLHHTLSASPHRPAVIAGSFEVLRGRSRVPKTEVLSVLISCIVMRIGVTRSETCGDDIKLNAAWTVSNNQNRRLQDNHSALSCPTRCITLSLLDDVALLRAQRVSKC